MTHKVRSSNSLINIEESEEKRIARMKWIKILFIGCFVAFIGFTGLKTIAGKEAKSLTEGRSLTQFPDLDYSENDERFISF